MERMIRRIKTFLLIYSTISCSLIALGQPSVKTDSLLILLDKTESDTSKVSLLIQLSDSWISDDIKLSLEYIQRALSLAEKTGNTKVIASTLNSMAKVSLRAGLIDISADYFNRYLEMITDNGSKMEIGYTMFNLGSVRMVLNDYDKAEEMFLKSFQMIKEFYAEANDSVPPTVIINLYNNLGIIHREKSQLDESVQYLNNGIKSARTGIGFEPDLIRLLINLGETLIKQKKLNEATLALNEALSIARKNNNKATESAVYLSLGNLSEENENTKAAFEYYRTGYRLAIQFGDVSMLQVISYPLAKLYKKTGQADSSLKYLTLSNEYQEKLNLEKAKDNLLRQELNAQFREREQVLEARDKNRKIWEILILLMIIAIALISFYFTFKKLRKIQADKAYIKQKAQELKEIIETKDKLFSIIAHDLRGPIGNFIPALELLTSNNAIDENLKKRLLAEMKKDSKNTYSLLDDLLTWAGIHGNSIQITPQNFVLNEALIQNVVLLTPGADQKSISISIETTGIITVFADKNTISTVVRNLLSNAIKFTPMNGSITVSAKHNSRYCEVTIADSGVGMSKEIADNLLISRSYYTTFGTNGEKGSGLGLAICREFVEKNGGEIWLESEQGKGSKFIFTIPLEKQNI
jgi:signal transduction histidine kinase